MSVRWDVRDTGGAAVFAVFQPAFQPSEDLRYFYDSIDCYYLRVDSLHCFWLELFGDSFGSQHALRQHFAGNTQTSTDAQRLEFTPCSLGSAMYATLKVSNLSLSHPSVWRAAVGAGDLSCLWCPRASA